MNEKPNTRKSTNNHNSTNTNMVKLKVALLMGGKSAEHEVSLTSACSIAQALDPQKYEVIFIGIDSQGKWLLPNQNEIRRAFSEPRTISLEKYNKHLALLPGHSLSPFFVLESETTVRSLHLDLIIPVLHGPNGEDGTVQGLLELLPVAYVGSGVLGSALCMDKDLTKQILSFHNISVVPWLSIRKNEFQSQEALLLNQIESTLGFPCFVKPCNLGSSVGVSKIKSKEDAIEEINKAFQYDYKVIVEKAIDGRELEISVLGNECPKASCVGEIVPLHEFYTYEAKYLDENGAELYVPAENVSKELESTMQEMAIKAFKKLECWGLARVDFFLERKTGRVFLNELNTFPGFTSISMYPKLWEASGVTYPQLLDQLIQLAMERFRMKKELK